MVTRRIVSVVAPLSVVVTIGAIYLGLIDPQWLGSTAVVRLAIFSGFGATALALTIADGRLRRRTHDAAQLYLERLATFDELGDLMELEETLPRLPKAHPLKAPLESVSGLLKRLHKKCQDIADSQSGAEVRLQQLHQQRQRINEILSGLSEPVLAIDQFNELVVSNPSAAKLFDFDADDLERRTIDQLVECNELVQLMLDTRRRRLPAQRSAEIELSSEDGSVREFRVTCRGLSALAEGGDGNQEHGVVAVLSDISDRREIQRRNAEFVSAVSHEMKTPLAGVKAYVEMLLDNDAEDEETREEFLRVIEGQADRLQRLINNLLNLARIEAGVVDVRKEYLSLNEVLEEAYDVIAPSASQKNINVRSDLSPLYLSVLADRDMILQAAINLLSNAVKYTPDGGNVTLRSRLEENRVVFEVQDSGVGIRIEDQTAVFSKFFRVAQHKQMASGTGLGLPLAKHIVEDVHGGELTLQSELGKGSRFRVTVPNVGP